MEENKNDLKTILKQPKYILPVAMLPLILYFGYQVIELTKDKDKKVEKKEELSTDLGSVEDKLLNKNEAYDKLFKSVEKKRSMIQGIDTEVDSFFVYSDNLDEYQKRFIDSLEYVNSIKKTENKKSKDSFYKPNKGKSKNPYTNENGYSNFQSNNSNAEDEDFNKSLQIIQMLNEQNKAVDEDASKSNKKEYDPVKAMREQMIFLDSIEKSRDPELRAKAEANERLKAKKDKMEAFLNTTEDVVKSSNIGGFNHVSREQHGDFIKAIIDENVKGYLGSRIRIRLLEDVYVGKKLLPKGSFLYAEISGFTLQRVNLNIVSVIINNEIKPINLAIYDTDGLKGLHVPASFFREMVREFGSNSVQGVSLEGGSGQDFFTSIGAGLFKSVSETIASVIRKNKVNLKYNSYVYLINEKDLKNNE
ncbi:MAG: conjugative transposon protein TraM [Bacteroidota bacterium]|nr:conjugative transposon protein TraM [Bacteroidota bacterium]